MDTTTMLKTKAAPDDVMALVSKADSNDAFKVDIYPKSDGTKECVCIEYRGSGFDADEIVEDFLRLHGFHIRKRLSGHVQVFKYFEY